VLTSGDVEIFPESWRKSPISAQGAILADDQVDRARQIMERALKKYPPAVLEKNLKTIYVLSELKYSGITAGGTNSLNSVYLKMREPKQGYTDAKMEALFHAEFSSILYRNFAKDFDKEAWKKLNPADFKYLGSGVDAIRQNKASVALDEKLHEDGFLEQYGQSDMENDFNSYTAKIFSGDAKQWDLYDRYPKLKGKVKLVIDFYQKVDPTFTVESFKKLK
jgi:hypothetical protein